MEQAMKERRNHIYYPEEGEGGFVLVVAMVVLVLLTIIGISATNMTNVELQIAGNDKVHKTTFYRADGGTEIGMLMIEENVSCPKGFAGTIDNTDPDTFIDLGGVQVADTRFALDETPSDVPGASGSTTSDDLPVDTIRSIRVPVDIQNANDTNPRTNLAIYGETRLSAGSAIQMAAGYDGKGKGAGSSGAYIAYDVLSQHYGTNNSETVLRVQWRHLIGQEGVCNY